MLLYSVIRERREFEYSWYAIDSAGVAVERFQILG